MPQVNAPLYSLNGGEVDDEALARLDLERMQFAASRQEGVISRTVGAITLRPGMGHKLTPLIGQMKFIDYNYSGDADVIPVATASALRFLVDDEFVSRESVSTTVLNGDFTSAFTGDPTTGWADISEGSAIADFDSNRLRLAASQFDIASVQQEVSVALADRGTEHGLRVDVYRGPIQLRIGSTSGSADLMPSGIEITLEDGDHSIAFTPEDESFFIEFFNEEERRVLVSSCQIEAAGDVVLETPWTATDLPNIQTRQSIDVIYCCDGAHQQREILRWSNRSWSIQRYKSNDGPFKFYSGKITMTPNNLRGNVNITSSRSYFYSAMTGRLLRLLQTGQRVEAEVTDTGQGTDPIRISGVGVVRKFTVSVSGTFTGSIALQVSTDNGSGEPSGWTTNTTYTGVTTQALTDSDDNVIKFYRLYVTGWTSGTAEIYLDYPNGSATGTARILAVNSPTSAYCEVLSPFYKRTATTDWDYTNWSDYDGWPNAVEIFGGRVFWFRRDDAFGSISDLFHSYDDEEEGDAAPILRSVGSGGQKGTLWVLALQRLIAGTDVSEVSIRSSAYDEPLTAGNWFPLDASTQGCAAVPAVKIDTDGIFTQADKQTLFRISWDGQAQDYASTSLNQLHQEIFGDAEIVKLAVQRRPDTILWCILSDGQARCLSYDPKENVIAWSRFVTDGTIEDITVNRGSGEDNVYFSVLRQTTRRIEKLAKFKDCRGGPNCALMDAYKSFEVTTAQTVFDMSHLSDGTEVVVWANDTVLHDQSDMLTVSGGNITLSASVENTTVNIGLPYTGTWRSTKLAYGAANGTALFQPKRVSHLGLYFVKTMFGGVFIGRDDEHLLTYTTTKNGAQLDHKELQATYDCAPMPMNGGWDTDSRIHIEMRSPYPCTIAALAMKVETKG